MINYSAFDYLCINVANAKGMDKELFETRIQWVRDNFHRLEEVDISEIDEPILYVKAVLSLRNACKTGKSNAIVHLDAVCSGIQIMSALGGCVSGATHTGLIDSGTRPDLYTFVQTTMNQDLIGSGIVVDVSRADIKSAVMKSGYGSTKVPKDLFEPMGVLTEFYEAFTKVAPVTVAIQEALLTTWNPEATHHEWVLPDGFHVKAPVTIDVEKRIEIDELNHTTISVQYTDIGTKEHGRANVANAIHSIDSLVLRNMLRRCSYDPMVVRTAYQLIHAQLEAPRAPVTDCDVGYYIDLFTKNQWVDPVILPYIDEDNVTAIPEWILKKLLRLTSLMLEHEPFELVTVHDSFGSHAVNLNRVRFWYKEILAELNESEILTSIWNHLGKKGTFKKKANIADLIRGGEYALA